MFPCVLRTVKTGGKTARMTSPVKVIGTRDGTGPQVPTGALQTASAERGLKFTPHPRPCVNKSGLIPTFIPPTPEPQADACSSGSMGQTPTRRWLSSITALNRNKAQK